MTAVAGDFYDFLVVDEQRVGILVADVTGQGVPAALIPSMLKIALAAQSAHVAEPAQALAGLNHALCGKPATRRSCSAHWTEVSQQFSGKSTPMGSCRACWKPPRTPPSNSHFAPEIAALSMARHAFLTFLQRQSHLAAGPLITASLAEVARWSRKGDGGVREDDITLIAIDFEPMR